MRLMPAAEGLQASGQSPMPMQLPWQGGVGWKVGGGQVSPGQDAPEFDSPREKEWRAKEKEIGAGLRHAVALLKVRKSFHSMKV